MNKDTNNTLDQKILTFLYNNRKLIIWMLIFVVLFWLINKLYSLFVLLLASYAVSILLDPLISYLQIKKIPRSISILTIEISIVILVVILVAYALPVIAAEYSVLMSNFPNYLIKLYKTIDSFLEHWLSFSLPNNVDSIMVQVQDQIKTLGIKQLSIIGQTIGKTIIDSYAFTISFLNILMIPFFIFYLTRDLATFHKFIGSFLPTRARQKLQTVGTEILSHVYVFFKGQLTVAILLSILYIVSLSLIDLPYAVVVGLISGLLGIIPYLGFLLGTTLATIIILVTSFSWTNLLLVWLVFLINSSFESFFLTPKLIGNKMGIHPLGVLLALIVGGQLMGILGIILAIPIAASVRVLFKHIMAQHSPN